MKKLFLAVALLAVVGCKHNESKPQDPVVIVKPPVEPSPAPVADLCKAEGKAIECEAQLGYQHKLGCVVAGDYKPVYFADVNAAEVWANAKPEYLKIKMKDGSTKNVGPYAFGWHCKEL